MFAFQPQNVVYSTIWCAVHLYQCILLVYGTEFECADVFFSSSLFQCVLFSFLRWLNKEFRLLDTNNSGTYVFCSM